MCCGWGAVLAVRRLLGAWLCLLTHVTASLRPVVQVVLARQEASAEQMQASESVSAAAKLAWRLPFNQLAVTEIARSAVWASSVVETSKRTRLRNRNIRTSLTAGHAFSGELQVALYTCMHFVA